MITLYCDFHYLQAHFVRRPHWGCKWANVAYT